MEFKDTNKKIHPEVGKIKPGLTVADGILLALDDAMLKEGGGSVVYTALSTRSIYGRYDYAKSLELLSSDKRIDELGNSVFDFTITKLFNEIDISVQVDSLVEDMDDLLAAAKTNDLVKKKLSLFKQKLDTVIDMKEEVSYIQTTVTPINKQEFLSANVFCIVKDIGVTSELSRAEDGALVGDKTLEFIKKINEISDIVLHDTYMVTVSGKTYHIHVDLSGKITITRVM